MPKLNKCIHRKEEGGFVVQTATSTRSSSTNWFSCKLKMDKNEHNSFKNMKCDGRNCGNYTPKSCFTLFDVKMKDGKNHRNVIMVNSSKTETTTVLLTFYDRKTLVIEKDQVIELKGKKPDWDKLESDAIKRTEAKN